jgi:hypothetical protein
MSAETELIALRARITELEDRLQYLYKRLNIEYIEHPSTVDPRLIDHLRKGNKIEAIKLYREIFDVGLAEAKNAVEEIEKNFGI